ncbi:hypothetical protein [Chengkuizengella axinellae]|uniref:Uncharacterized protein n=1 Tax=Chengkuizengella axinellae TaxID=3064388 RepID=A0ABT9J6E2_9BACL|nr:hypothetical protein [Chengkuizengella sp. 2205SS18-9]MDP5277191.1 hypothetical protein [Chengkuizengella sp. 2205SS18-9]
MNKSSGTTEAEMNRYSHNNLCSLWHMARQRSHELSPNGKEAEPQISKVVTEADKSIEPYLPRFYESLVNQIGKGYR